MVADLICLKRTVGEWDYFSYKSCDVGFLGWFCLNVLLMLHEQVYFIDSCAFNVEGWVELLGRSKGKVCC